MQLLFRLETSQTSRSRWTMKRVKSVIVNALFVCDNKYTWFNEYSAASLGLVFHFSEKHRGFAFIEFELAEVCK